MSLACCFNANARVEKTTLDLSGMKQLFAWAGTAEFKDNILTTIGTGDNNDAVNLGFGLTGLGLNIADYDRIVVKAQVKTKFAGFHVRVFDNGDGGNCQVSLDGNNLEEQVITIDFQNGTLKTNNDIPAGKEPSDMTVINEVYIWTMSVGSLAINEIYLEKDITDYDEVSSKPGITSFDLSQMTECLNWGGKAYYDANTQILKYEGTPQLNEDGSEKKDENGNTIYGLNYRLGFKNLEYNVADYDNIVINVQMKEEGGWHALHLFVSDYGQYGNYVYEIPKRKLMQTFKIPLKNLMTNSDNGDNTPRKIETIREISFWTMSIGAEYIVKELYLEKSNEPVTYLTRENLTSDKFGTICLPFTATKPENAYIYNVKGVNSKDAPKTLYIEAAETLEAGKAYIFQSTNNQDIVFTKTGGEEVTEPIKNEALTGVFDDTESVPAGEKSYILKNGEWRYVPQNNNNTVAKYRAYLNLNNAEVISETSAAKYTRMQVNGGGTTGVNAINAAAENDNTAIFNLNGVKVVNPTKGVYIKNGKKLIIK